MKGGRITTFLKKEERRSKKMVTLRLLIEKKEIYLPNNVKTNLCQ
jgi:hypothetical protein